MRSAHALTKTLAEHPEQSDRRSPSLFFNESIPPPNLAFYPYKHPSHFYPLSLVLLGVNGWLTGWSLVWARVSGRLFLFYLFTFFFVQR
jgi:hypothetical protein